MYPHASERPVVSTYANSAFAVAALHDVLRRGVVAALDASTGGLASLPAGTLATTKDSLGNVTQTSSPVTGGEHPEFVVSVGNNAALEVTNALEPYDSSDALLDSRTATLPGEATEIVTLGYATSETRPGVTFTITVRGGGNRDSERVTVHGAVKRVCPVHSSTETVPVAMYRWNRRSVAVAPGTIYRRPSDARIRRLVGPAGDRYRETKPTLR